ELREFIDAVFPQETPEAKNARIVREFIFMVKLLFQRGIIAENLVSIDQHRAEFQVVAKLAVAVDKLPPVKNRAAILELKQKGNERDEKQSYNAARQPNDAVEHRLYR